MIRLVSGVLLAAAFFALIWFANPLVLLVVTLGVATLAVQEYAQLFRPIGADVPMIPVVLATWGAAAMVPYPYIRVEAAVTLGLVVIAVCVMARLKADGFARASISVAAAALAPIYIGLSLGTLVGIHALLGRNAVLLLIATVVVSDSAQYYAGRTFGRRPLAPTLSPKKTIEGAIGGLVVAPAFLAGAGPFFLRELGHPVRLAILGVAIVVAGIAGDLFESMLKRAAGVKDSSALIPGHGGVLDRIDALLFAAPVFYLYITVFITVIHDYWLE